MPSFIIVGHVWQNLGSSPIREKPPKSPSWTGLKNLYKEFLRLFFNPFIPNAPFLYPLKTSAILTVFRCFQKIEETCIETNMLALKRSLTLPCGFSKNLFFRERRWRYVFCDFQYHYKQYLSLKLHSSFRRYEDYLLQY